jgi:hypothetical protein
MFGRRVRAAAVRHRQRIGLEQSQPEIRRERAAAILRQQHACAARADQMQNQVGHPFVINTHTHAQVRDQAGTSHPGWWSSWWHRRKWWHPRPSGNSADVRADRSRCTKARIRAVTGKLFGVAHPDEINVPATTAAYPAGRATSNHPAAQSSRTYRSYFDPARSPDRGTPRPDPHPASRTRADSWHPPAHPPRCATSVRDGWSPPRPRHW